MFLKTFDCYKSILCVALLLFFSHQAQSQADLISGSISISKTNYSPGTGPNRLIVDCIANEDENNVRSHWGGQPLDVAYAITRILDISGQHMRASIYKEGDQIVVDGAELAAGVYMLQVSDELMSRHVWFVRN